MPPVSKLKLPPLNTSNKEIGERLAKIRKEKGYTQIQLAAKMGLVQTLISNYEIGRLRLNAEMIIRFALALEVSSDRILGLDKITEKFPKTTLNILRRLNKIKQMPLADQKALFKTIDLALNSGGKKT